jgi:1,2-diacylglycerol 3-beta-glucosyltransferase
VFGDLLLALGVLYSLQLLLAAAMLLRAPRPAIPPSPLPPVSVVVAARNEEALVGACLASLAGLEYPAGRLEVILVDDRSTDRTREIASAMAAAHPHIRVVEAPEGKGGPGGKANALACGIDAASGEVLLLTDADCAVPPGWAMELVRNYGDPRTGLAAGFTELRARSVFEGMQTLDWFFLFGLASAAMEAGLPITAVGTNLSVRRAAYDRAGGYRGIPFSVTEDEALVRAVTRRGGWRGRFPAAPGALVTSEPCPDLRTLFRQKLRWFTGGRGMEPRVLVAFAADYLFLLLLGLSLIAGPLGPALGALALALGGELLCLAAILRRFRRLSLLRWFPAFALYLHLYVLILPLMVAVKPKVRWKGREL